MSCGPGLPEQARRGSHQGPPPHPGTGTAVHNRAVHPRVYLDAERWYNRSDLLSLRSNIFDCIHQKVAFKRSAIVNHAEQFQLYLYCLASHNPSPSWLFPSPASKPHYCYCGGCHFAAVINDDNSKFLKCLLYAMWSGTSHILAHFNLSGNLIRKWPHFPVSMGVRKSVTLPEASWQVSSELAFSPRPPGSGTDALAQCPSSCEPLSFRVHCLSLNDNAWVRLSGNYRWGHILVLPTTCLRGVLYFLFHGWWFDSHKAKT